MGVLHVIVVCPMDSHPPLREFNDLPEPLRLTNVSFDCLLGATTFLIIYYPRISTPQSFSQNKKRYISRSVPESTK